MLMATTAFVVGCADTNPAGQVPGIPGLPPPPGPPSMPVPSLRTDFPTSTWHPEPTFPGGGPP
ncbi:MAG: hypothetical protein AUI14_26600 [Actinobacteria bacterium 13_2_20CM_2_71_6]|nr:MAG: hypothetical protein AUI14_26600 [Actinobacteria bacterium 13_2_20CM_2_71_6]